MVAKFNGKDKGSKENPSPAGKPVKHAVKEIKSKASEAKKNGGSADLGSGIGNS